MSRAIVLVSLEDGNLKTIVLSGTVEVIEADFDNVIDNYEEADDLLRKLERLPASLTPAVDVLKRLEEVRDENTDEDEDEDDLDIEDDEDFDDEDDEDGEELCHDCDEPIDECTCFDDEDADDNFDDDEDEPTDLSEDEFIGDHAARLAAQAQIAESDTFGPVS